MLAREGADGGAAQCAAAAARVHDKLHAHLSPLVGVDGVQALLVRSASLAQREFPFLQRGVVDGSESLREALQGQEHPAAMAAATALFGTFFTLLTTFVGEGLTAVVIGRGWPVIDEATPRKQSP